MPVRLLLVEDDEALREVAAETLAAAGFEVTQAAGGLEALHRMAESPFDVLLLDAELPGLGGVQTLAILRAHGHEIPVVMWSGSVDLRGEDRARLRVGPVLRKPVSGDTLVLAIRHALASR